ncbi:MAG: hypothetical protein AB1566_04860 [Chloroflexota bacterium]
MTTSVEVRPVVTEEDLRLFVRFPWRIYAKDPSWVPPLISELEKRLDVNRNRFFQYAEREIFLARRNKEVAGTIAAIVNHQHNQQFHERTGFWASLRPLTIPR